MTNKALELSLALVGAVFNALEMAHLLHLPQVH
jgi:hypothetical protein